MSKIVRRLAQKYCVRASDYPVEKGVMELEDPATQETTEVDVSIEYNYIPGSKGSRGPHGEPMEPDDPEEYEIDSIEFARDFDFMGRKYKKGDDVPEDILPYANGIPSTMDDWAEQLYMGTFST